MKWHSLTTLIVVCVLLVFGKALAATLTETPANVASGGTVSATWGAIASPTNRDWIGLYTLGNGDAAFRDWIYVSCTKSPGGASINGSCPFTIPVSIANGTYELRLYANDGFGGLATSNQFIVVNPNAATLVETPANVPPGGTVKVTWGAIAAPTSRDWIGLYRPTAGDATFIDWVYLGCSKGLLNTAASGFCNFLIPSSLPQGIYEFRLFANDGFTRLATSNQFNVTLGPRCIQPPNGLVSWWDAEGDAGDIVGNNHGTLENGASFASGKVGRAFQFDGINDFVKIPNASSLNQLNQFSLEFWMRGDPTNPMNSCCQGLVTSDMYAIEGFDGQRGIALIVSSNNGGSFVGAGTLWGDGYPSGFGLIPGQWHHVAGTYDGSLLWLYVDGKLKSAMVHEGNISQMVPTSFLSFGSEDGRTYNLAATAGRYFRGLIDEVSYYNRALTPVEIAGIYDAGEQGKCK